MHTPPNSINSNQTDTWSWTTAFKLGHGEGGELKSIPSGKKIKEITRTKEFCNKKHKTGGKISSFDWTVLLSAFLNLNLKKYYSRNFIKVENVPIKEVKTIFFNAMNALNYFCTEYKFRFNDVTNSPSRMKVLHVSFSLTEQTQKDSTTVGSDIYLNNISLNSQR